MLDYKDSPAGIEALMPWRDFIKERCIGGSEQKFAYIQKLITTISIWRYQLADYNHNRNNNRYYPEYS